MPYQYIPKATALPNGLTVSESKKNAHPCPTCSRELYLRKKKMSKVLVIALREIARVNIEAKRPATIKDMEAFATREPALKGRKLTLTNNYTGLKYCGFIEPVKLTQDDEDDEEDDKLGWKITTHGADFLNGQITIPETLYVFHDLVRENPNKPYTFIHISEAKDSRATSRRKEAMESDALLPSYES